jgi:hypothetical protein
MKCPQNNTLDISEDKTREMSPQKGATNAKTKTRARPKLDLEQREILHSNFLHIIEQRQFYSRKSLIKKTASKLNLKAKPTFLGAKLTVQTIY